MSVTFPDGRRDKRVRLQQTGTQEDGKGGYTDVLVDLTPAYVHAAIAPITTRELERAAAGTVITAGSHLITIPFHAQVSTDTQITYANPRTGTTHTYRVNALQNPEEADRLLLLTAQELVPDAV